MKRPAALAFLATVAAIAAPAPANADQTVESVAPAPAVPMPRTLDICLLGATIAPFQKDGTPWQSSGGRATAAEVRGFAGALAAVGKLAGAVYPHARLLELAPAAAKLMPQPQPMRPAPHAFGFFEIARHGAYTGKAPDVRELGTPNANFVSLKPDFHACFKDVEWDPDMRVRLRLSNRHSGGFGQIATVEIPASYIERIYRLGVVSQTFVGSQDQNLPFVSLDVTKGVSSVAN